MICSNCANRLASAYDFAMRVSASDKRFAELTNDLLDDESKIIECVDDVEFISDPEIIQINEMIDISNVDELDDSITVSDHEQQDNEDEENYVIRTARTGHKRMSDDSGNYVAVPQYTITTQQQEVDMSDIFNLSKSPVIVKTVDVAAVHIASENLEFNDSLMCKDYENDTDSMYMCKYCPKGKFEFN